MDYIKTKLVNLNKKYSVTCLPRNDLVNELIQEFPEDCSKIRFGIEDGAIKFTQGLELVSNELQEWASQLTAEQITVHDSVNTAKYIADGCIDMHKYIANFPTHFNILGLKLFKDVIFVNSNTMSLFYLYNENGIGDKENEKTVYFIYQPNLIEDIEHTKYQIGHITHIFTHYDYQDYAFEDFIEFYQFYQQNCNILPISLNKVSIKQNFECSFYICDTEDHPIQKLLESNLKIAQENKKITSSVSLVFLANNQCISLWKSLYSREETLHDESLTLTSNQRNRNKYFKNVSYLMKNIGILFSDKTQEIYQKFSMTEDELFSNLSNNFALEVFFTGDICLKPKPKFMQFAMKMFKKNSHIVFGKTNEAIFNMI